MTTKENVTEAIENYTLQYLLAEFGMKFDTTSLASAVKALRCYAGFSQSDFAKALELTPQTFSELENGKTNRPSFDTLAKLIALAKIGQLKNCEEIFSNLLTPESRKNTGGLTFHIDARGTDSSEVQEKVHQELTKEIGGIVFKTQFKPCR
jgi:transcriptional regulator with XRE-family HTH domain